MDSSHAGSFSSYRGSVYETETQRLQREVDTFTRKLEQERRRRNLLAEQVKNVELELAQKKQRMKMSSHKNITQKKSSTSIRSLDNQLEQAISKYNETLAQNKKLRGQIDVLRREKKNQKTVFEHLQSETARAENEAKSKYNENKYAVESSNEINNKIVALRAKHEDEKGNFVFQINELQSQLKSDKKKQENQMKHMNSFMMGHNDKGVSDIVDPTQILKRRLARWSAANKDKKRVIDHYQRNVRIIEDAFKQIEEATGISDKDEIVTTFIKSEEQTYSLYNYVNVLNQDIDTLEENNKEISKEIQRYEALGESSVSKKKEILDRLQEQIAKIENSRQSKEAECQEIKDTLNNIQQYCTDIIEAFSKSKFYLTVAENMTYDSETQFTEHNVIQFLAELEEYINNLITYVAFKGDQNSAALSTIPIDKLAAKEFTKQQIQIDVPTSGDLLSDDDDDDDSRVPFKLSELKTKTIALLEKKKMQR
mmetsp:Transcript_24291/g.27553  ORF Transcript_24291/g.27553 Transcript_24291/m.27553 type:complete len:482 (+) Transcript_24291:141-1586(+)